MNDDRVVDWSHRRTQECNNLISAELNDKWGFVDQTGKWVVKPKFERVWKFDENGLAPARMNDKWGFIDQTGKWIIEPQFREILYFWFHLGDKEAAMVQIDDKVGIIDKTGEWVLEPTFDWIDTDFTLAEKESAGAVINDKWGIIDKNAYLCSGLKGLPKRDFGILTTRNQGNQV